jgi:hypothetical protein
MRSSLHKGRTFFEYLVDALDLDDRTWITEDPLRISLAPCWSLSLKVTGCLMNAPFWKS